MSVRGDPGATPGSAARLRTGEALEALGFAPLGVLRERGPLGALARETDAYASRARGAFADVLPAGPGAPRGGVQLFTPFPDGAAVLTTDLPRRAVTGERLQVRALPGAALEALLAEHALGVVRLRAGHGAPAVAEELVSRVGAAGAWYRGAGRRELRRDNLVPFAVALLGLALLASSAHILLRVPPAR